MAKRLFMEIVSYIDFDASIKIMSEGCYQDQELHCSGCCTVPVLRSVSSHYETPTVSKSLQSK